MNEFIHLNVKSFILTREKLIHKVDSRTMSVSDEDEVLKAESEEEDEGKEKEISGQEDKVNKIVLCVLF